MTAFRLRPLTRLHPLMVATSLVLSTVTMTASAQTPTTSTAAHDGTLLSVSASAEASRVPDIATLSTGVVTQATDANSALRQNSEQMSKVVATIKASGVAEKDIQTSGINIQPQYRYAENQPPTITGYQASNNVSIKVRNIANLGKVLDALVASGANQVNGPSFEIDQPEAVYDEARQAALAKARQRAEMYAKSLDLKVRRIVSISEGGGFQPPMPIMMKAMAMDSRERAAPPVSPGETSLSASLDVVFELGR